jgi:DNA-binding Lrp family transcriptional regulator
MVTTVVLMNIRHDKINAVAEALAGMDGISEVYSVGGRYDLVTIIRVPDNDALADVVTNQMAGIEGIESTETLIAFRAFSSHDLEAMFSIGN